MKSLKLFVQLLYMLYISEQCSMGYNVVPTNRLLQDYHNDINKISIDPKLAVRYLWNNKLSEDG